MLPIKTERECLENKYKDSIAVNKMLSRKLVSFQANKCNPFYSWFPYKEGFSSQMVKMFISEYHKEKGVILDPFAGALTTLFSAQEIGFDSIGVEIMPIGEFILKTRQAIKTLDINKFNNILKTFTKLDFSKLPISNLYDFKHVPITEKAFSTETEYKLNSFINYIQTKVSDLNIRQLLRFACFCILEKISYTRKDGQCLRWDARSGKSNGQFNKGKIFSFEEAVFEQLHKMSMDIQYGHNNELFPINNEKQQTTALKLITGSTLEVLPTFTDNSIDLVITSPPYCNRYDYTRTYALELVFLGLSGEDIIKLRQKLLSSTVENKEKVELLKNLYAQNGQTNLFNKAENSFKKNKALQEVLGILNSYNDEKKLNNSGIYRMVKNYFYEHAFVIFEMARILKKEGRIYYVNDNVRYAGETIPVDLILSEFASDAGLMVDKIQKLERGKGNSSQQMGAHGREELRKCVYLWRKP